jgi:hypothetical protein
MHRATSRLVTVTGIAPGSGLLTVNLISHVPVEIWVSRRRGRRSRSTECISMRSYSAPSHRTARSVPKVTPSLAIVPFIINGLQNTQYIQNFISLLAPNVINHPFSAATASSTTTENHNLPMPLPSEPPHPPPPGSCCGTVIWRSLHRCVSYSRIGQPGTERRVRSVLNTFVQTPFKRQKKKKRTEERI